MPEPIVRGFGRRHIPDVRDNQFPMRAVLRAQPLPSSRYYNTGKNLPLDQGETGTCVAHAWTGFLCAALLMCRNPPNVFDTYRGIVAIDEFPENDSEATATDIADLQGGTSVRAGAQYLRTKGHVKSFLWTRSADEAATWLLSGKGTIVLGTRWDWNMSTLDKKGFANLGGGEAGGHAYLATGYNRVSKAFRCLNSWGREFGQLGKFWVRHDDMQRLIHEDGEACAAVEQLVPAQK